MKPLRFQRLYFEKISKYNRTREPVSVSIPFAEGTLDDPERLVVRDGERRLPLQSHVLAAWEDGSVKWLLAHFQPDLPGNADKALMFEIADRTIDSPRPEVEVRVEEREAGIQVDTGPLVFRLPREGFLPFKDVALNGKTLWEGQPFTGFYMRCARQALSTASGPVELEIVEAGPLRAVVLVQGKHRREDGSGFIELRGRVTAYAGKSYVEVEHTFLHTEDMGALKLEELRLDVRPPVHTTPRLALGEGYYRTQIQEGTEPLECSLDAETILYQSNEHYVDCFYGDFWADWREEGAGMALSIHQAHQNFPKALRVTPEGITCSLFPSNAPPATVYQGMGKTHQILVHFHDGTIPLEEISARSLQFQLPDRPSLPRAWVRENNPWGMPLFPERIPDRLTVKLIQSQMGRPAALGMFHFGDAPDAGYTDQGRGRGLTVWVNNEYDRAHACTVFYGLIGERPALESALVAARHWLDVDLCHKSDDPLRYGGLVVHSAHHVSGSVTPSHEWVEGLLDYYHLTGRREGLEAARMVAENVLRHLRKPAMREPGASSAREGGWALRTLVAMVQETGEERYRSEARRIVDQYLTWHEQFGGMLAPYTNHSMPRVPFMIAIAANSLARYLLIEDDDRVERLIVETADDLIEHCLGPGGILYYKELPSLRRPAPTVHAIETFTHAYRLTKNRRYLEAAARQFAAFIEGFGGGRGGPKRLIEDGAVIRGHGGGRTFAASYTSLMLFAEAAVGEGLLDRFEYPM